MSAQRITRRADGFDDRLIPPGVHDARANGFLAAIREGQDLFPPEGWLIDFATVDASLLPSLVRGLSLQDFMFPGIDEATVRRFLKAANQLHAEKGKSGGIAFALSLIDLKLDYVDWHEETPPGPPNTYRAVIYATDRTPRDRAALPPVVRQAATRMFRNMQRWSQAPAVPRRFGVSTAAPGRLGSIARAGGMIVHRAFNPTPQTTAAPLRSAAFGRAAGLVVHESGATP